MSDAPRPLDQIQRWMQDVISHPEGVVPGVEAARTEIDVSPDDIEQVVCRSQALSSVERLEVYANAYYSRLIECLADEFPILAQTLGEETFQEFAFAYLQSYPSRSYTLTVLGATAQYLDETRPRGEMEDNADASAESWPEFLVDLARLEWAFNEVFDGPGTERTPPLDVETLRTVPAERWPDAILRPVPCLRLMEFRFPVNRFYAAVRAGEDPPPPEPGPSYLAITRRDYVVRRHDLSREQYLLLKAIVAGEPVSHAIATLAEDEAIDIEQLAGDLQRWFFEWAREQFFAAVELPA